MHAIIADDVTGAGDSGIHFAAAGRRIALLLNHGALPGALRTHDMAALSSESRLLPPGDAAQAVRRTLAACRAAGAERFYKKIDSTLRGNPGAEIAAMLEGGLFRAALVCPSMPKTGRTVLDGKLYLHGKPLDCTEGGKDPFSPVPTADIAAILAAQTALPAAKLSLGRIRAGGEALAQAVAEAVGGGARILVADAESDEDLARIADALRNAPDILPVGAGGLAEAIAGGARPYAGATPAGRMLAVAGSVTKVTREQAEYAAAQGGFRVLDMDLDAWTADSGAELRRLRAQAALDDRPLLLKNRVAPSGRIEVADGLRAAAMFAEAARAVAVAGGCGILYATGGSTAVSVLERLGVHAVTMEREYMPGVAMSSFAPEGTGLRWFISKSGGFGGPDTIVRLAEALRA